MIVHTAFHRPHHDRLREHTSDKVLEKIDQATLEAIADVADSPEAIRARLSEIDREWDVDRALMLNFAVIGAVTAGMTMRNLWRERRLGVWGAMFWTQISFLAHHAIRGWCPPMLVFRRLGFRTQQEIGAERAALQNRLDELEREVLTESR